MKISDKNLLFHVKVKVYVSFLLLLFDPSKSNFVTEHGRDLVLVLSIAIHCLLMIHRT